MDDTFGIKILGLNSIWIRIVEITTLKLWHEDDVHNLWGTIFENGNLVV